MQQRRQRRGRPSAGEGTGGAGAEREKDAEGEGRRREGSNLHRTPPPRGAARPARAPLPRPPPRLSRGGGRKGFPVQEAVPAATASIASPSSTPHRLFLLPRVPAPPAAKHPPALPLQRRAPALPAPRDPPRPAGTPNSFTRRRPRPARARRVGSRAGAQERRSAPLPLSRTWEPPRLWPPPPPSEPARRSRPVGNGGGPEYWPSSRRHRAALPPPPPPPPPEPPPREIELRAHRWARGRRPPRAGLSTRSALDSSPAGGRVCGAGAAEGGVGRGKRARRGGAAGPGRRRNGWPGRGGCGGRPAGGAGYRWTHAAPRPCPRPQDLAAEPNPQPQIRTPSRLRSATRTPPREPASPVSRLRGEAARIPPSLGICLHLFTFTY